MKPSSQPPRAPSRLSDSVHRQLSQYALAASAAGMGMLALTQSAEAKIVYTPAHRHVLLHHPLALDLNHDGIVDFKIRRGTFVYSSAPGTFVSANGVSSHQKGIRDRVAGIGYTGHTTPVQVFTTSMRMHCATDGKSAADLTFPLRSALSWRIDGLRVDILVLGHGIMSEIVTWA